MLLLVASLCVACAGPVGGPRFFALDTPHFRLVGDASRKDAASVAEGLELLRAVLEEVGVGASLAPRAPLLVYVLRDDSFERFRTLPDAESFGVGRPDASRIVVHGGADADPRAAAMHEYVHFVLRNGGTTGYPSWYDEGLAEFMSTLAIEGRYAVVGAIPEQRRDWLAHGSPASLRSMMTTEDPSAWSEPARDRFQAQAWALVHFFHLASRVELPDRQAQMLRYIALRDAGTPADEAAVGAFGTDFASLEQEYLRYVGRDELPVLGLPRERLALPPASAVRGLPRAEGLRLLGELALALGEERREEARRLLRDAVAADPEDALAHAGLGLALARLDPGASDAHLARALATRPDDAQVHRLQGEALLERAIAAGGDPALARAAADALRRSLARDPSPAAPWALLGRAEWIAAGSADAGAGLEALREAHARLPGNREIALALAQREAEHGSKERARALVLRWTPPSHGEPRVAGERTSLLALRDALGVAAAPGDPSLEARLDVQVPQPGERVRSLVGWVEVRGRGGFWDALHHDVVIAIDESESARGPAGSDVDGDGEIGQGVGPDWIGAASSDPGDRVIEAELEAVRALIRQLDARTTRIGLIAFAAEARVVAPLGTPEETLALLDRYREHAEPDGATSLAAALQGALDLFDRGRSSEVRRQRSVLLVSDGRPTHPTPARGAEQALALAERMGRIGVPVHSFALGRAAVEEPKFYQQLAEHAGGEFVPVVEPGDVVSQLSQVQFTGLRDVHVQSQPANQPGRAVRVFADGSFSGFAELVPGRNEISVTASLATGETLSDTFTIEFERPEAPSAEDRQAADRLLEEIQNRTIELELISEIRARSGQTRRLELRPAAPDSDGVGAGAQPDGE